MFAPIVVEPSFNFYFKSIGELLGGDFHDGLRLHVSGQFSRDGDIQLIGIAAADDFLFDHDFFEGKVVGVGAEQDASGKLAGGDSGIVRTEAQAGEAAAAESGADIRKERQMSIARALNSAFIAFDAGVVAGDPHNLDVALSENLRSLEKFAGTGDGHFLEANAAALINFAGHGNFLYVIGFGR